MGWLSDIISNVRLYTDEPTTKAKYSDSQIISMARKEWTSIVMEVNRNALAPIVVRHSITLSSGTQNYILPPNVKTILAVAEHDSTSDRPKWQMFPLSRDNPWGPGFLIEGNMLRLDPKWQGSSKTVRLSYVPNGDVGIHAGTAGTVTASTVVLDESGDITTGTLDTRPNAYAGCVLRILSATGNDYVQERVIASYAHQTRTATLGVALDPVPTGTITYEVVPILPLFNDHIVSLSVARVISAIEGDRNRYTLLTRLRSEKIRDLRLSEANLDGILGSHFEQDTLHNTRYLDWG